MNFKQQIQYNFNKSANTYDEVAFVQEKCAKLLVEFLIKQFNDFQPTTILDIGAGTGYLTQELLKHFNNSAYLLNDISSEMLKIARNKFNKLTNINFNEKDAEKEKFNKHSLIASNLCFQWFSAIYETITKLFNCCEVLAFSTLLKGTFSEWFSTAKLSSLNFPSENEIKKHCLALNPEKYFFNTQTFSVSFNSPLLFMKYLKMLGANLGNYEISALFKIIRNKELSIKTSYEVFFAILKK